MGEGEKKWTHIRYWGLARGASEEEVKAAYRALAQKYNPENYEAGPLREDAERKMNQINEAFDTVMERVAHRYRR